MDFFMTMVAKRVKPENTLRKVGTLMDRQRLTEVSVPVRSRLGAGGLHVGPAIQVLLLGRGTRCRVGKSSECRRCASTTGCPSAVRI